MDRAKRARRAGLVPLLMLLAGAGAPQAVTLPGARLFPESVSITPDGTAYVGSMGGGVLRVSLASGRAEPWIAPGAFGSGPLFGVLADRRNGMLWACSNDFSAAGLTVAGADPGSSLKGFDLKTGVGRISLTLPGTRPVCNDIAVGRDGAVYVTDTAASQILRWRPGATALELWSADPAFRAPPAGGLDGIAFAGDGNLYLNNVRSGDLYRVVVGADGHAGAVTRLATSRPLSGPDGMRPIGGMALAVAEGTGRIARVTIAGDAATVDTLAEGLAEPTGVDVHGGMLWYVQAQLSHLFNPAKRTQPPALPFRLTPLPLPK